MKKVLNFLGIFVVFGLFLVACGNSDSGINDTSSGNVTEITVMFSKVDGALK